MTQPQPKTKFEELIEILVGVYDSKSRSQQVMDGVEFEAKKLIRAGHPGRAYIVLGILELCRGNIKKMHYNHDNAVRVSGRDPEALFNYAVSLRRVGELAKSLSLAEETYEKSPTFEALSFVLDICKQAGDLKKYENYQNEYAKMTKDGKFNAQLDSFDILINHCAGLVTKPKREIISLAEELIQGVEVN